MSTGGGLRATNPLDDAIHALEKAIDNLFSVEQRLKRTGSYGKYKLRTQIGRLEKIQHRLDKKRIKHKNVSTLAELAAQPNYHCEACKSEDCIHDQPLRGKAAQVSPDRGPPKARW